MKKLAASTKRLNKVKLFGRGGGHCPLFDFIGNCVKKLAASTKRLNKVKLFGRGSGHWPLFYFIGNCVKKTCSEHKALNKVKLFGRGSGHWPLFDGQKSGGSCTALQAAFKAGKEKGVSVRIPSKPCARISVCPLVCAICLMYNEEKHCLTGGGKGEDQRSDGRY